MKADQKAELKSRMQRKIQELEKTVLSYRELTRPIPPDDAIGRLTRMEAISSRSVNEAALRKAENGLMRLRRAVERMDDPDFGLCGECEEPIPYKRLMIMPESDLCVRCAERISG